MRFCLANASDLTFEDIDPASPARCVRIGEPVALPVLCVCDGRKYGPALARQVVDVTFAVRHDIVDPRFIDIRSVDSDQNRTATCMNDSTGVFYAVRDDHLTVSARRECASYPDEAQR